MTYLRKRKLQKKLPRLYLFQHWGIITNSDKGRVIHNQTPGGVWGTKYQRWGIQYGRYKKEDLIKEWGWNRRKREYERRIFFTQRLNLHYFLYARQQQSSIYSYRNRNLCRNWIKSYGDLYFSDLHQPTK